MHTNKNTASKETLIISFDITKVKIKDLDGREVVLLDNLGKTLGNEIYLTVPSLDWLSIAQDFNAGRIAELSEKEANELVNIVLSPQIRLSMGVKEAIANHINELISTANHE